jgi:hypothetical protein
LGTVLPCERCRCTTVLTTNPWRHEDWRAAAALLRGKVAPGDALVVYTGRYMRALTYAMQEVGDSRYLKQVVYPRTGVAFSGELPSPGLPNEIARRYTDVWVLLSHDQAHPSATITALFRHYPHAQIRAFNLVRVARLSRR